MLIAHPNSQPIEVASWPLALSQQQTANSKQLTSNQPTGNQPTTNSQPALLVAEKHYICRL